MTKVLITGGAGFIGSHLTDRLLARGDEVLVIDNFSTARRDSLEPHERLTWSRGRSPTPSSSSGAFAFGPEVVVHAAASYKDPDGLGRGRRTNVVGTANVVQAAERAGASRGSSTSRPPSATASSRSSSRSRSSHPLRPGDSSYAISKTAGEHYVQLGGARLRSRSGWPTSTGRATSGPAADVLPPPDRRQAVLRDGHAPRLHLRRRPDRPASSARSTARAQPAPTTPPRAPTSPSRSCSTPPSPRSACRLDEVEVRERGEDDAFTILLDPARTHRDVRLDDRPRRSTRASRGAIAWYREHGIEQTFTHLQMPEGAHDAGRRARRAAPSSSAAQASSAPTSCAGRWREAPRGSSWSTTCSRPSAENVPDDARVRLSRGLDRRRRDPRSARRRARPGLPSRHVPRQPELDRRAARRPREQPHHDAQAARAAQGLAARRTRRLRRLGLHARPAHLRARPRRRRGRAGAARPRQPVPDLQGRGRVLLRLLPPALRASDGACALPERLRAGRDARRRRWRGTPATVWRNVDAVVRLSRAQGHAAAAGQWRPRSRDFIYVDDIVDGLLAWRKSGEPGDVYNLASGVETTIRELAETINCARRNRDSELEVRRAARLGSVGPALRQHRQVAAELGFEAGAAWRTACGGRSSGRARTSTASTPASTGTRTGSRRRDAAERDGAHLASVAGRRSVDPLGRGRAAA